MAVGGLHDQLVSFISYYAPNSGQVEFFSKMLEVLLPRVQGQVVLGGDSNIPLDRIMDKSDPVKMILKWAPNSSSKVARLLHVYDLIDAWWEVNPSIRDYAHYSQVHHTYSCIDHFFVHTSLLAVITSVKILSIPWSDHSPIKLALSGLWTKPRPSPWRLNAALLNNSIIYAKLQKELKNYFQENSSPVTFPAIIWAAHKATIRGELWRRGLNEPRNRRLNN